jgi:hypothetical protein
LQCATITVWETPSGTVANKATFLTLSEWWLAGRWCAMFGGLKFEFS